MIRSLLTRFVSMLGVLVAVLVLLTISLGATGFSNRMLEAAVGEQLRALRPSLAETIRDPDEIERVLEARRAELEASYGLDRPWYTRLPATMARVLTLDLGEARTLRSFTGSNRVSDIVLERLPNTMVLLTTALVITAALGLTVGTRMATRAGSITDRIVAYLAAVSFALPAWWVGILGILVFAFALGWLPSGGMISAPPPDPGLGYVANLAWHALLPVATLVVAGAGPYIYVVRTMTLDAAQSDHVPLARAKGIPERLVVRRHVLRVAAPPILTGLILGLAGSLGGSILVETVFSWPGMGRLYFDAIVGTPDEMVIVALTFIYTLIYVAARMLLEVVYVLVDPRVRYES